MFTEVEETEAKQRDEVHEDDDAKSLDGERVQPRERWSVGHAMRKSAPTVLFNLDDVKIDAIVTGTSGAPPPNPSGRARA